MLIVFKVTKKDIDDYYDFFWLGIYLGLFTAVSFTIYGIGYLLVSIPYKLYKIDKFMKELNDK